MVETEEEKRLREERERKAAGQTFIGRREKIASQRGLEGRRGQEEAARTLIEEGQQVPVPQAQAAGVAAQEQFFEPAEALSAELQEKIAVPPSLAPAPISEVIKERRQESIASAKRKRKFFSNLVTGKATKEEIAKEVKNFATGAAIAGVGLAAAFAIQAVAASTITASVLGKLGSITALKGSTVKLGGFVAAGFGLQAAFDFEGAEMDTYREVLQKVVEDGERLEAAQRNGLDPIFALGVLTEMEQGVAEAETRIKELGIYNINYRISKEYIVDQDKVRSARLAITRRIEAAINTARTGVASLPPEQLAFSIAQFSEGVGGVK